MIVIRLDGTTIIDSYMASWEMILWLCEHTLKAVRSSCRKLRIQWGLGRWYQLEETFETVTRDELFLSPGQYLSRSQILLLSKLFLTANFPKGTYTLLPSSEMAIPCRIQPTPRIVTLGLQSMEELSLVYVIAFLCRRWRTARRSKYWSYEAGNMIPNSRLLGIHWCIHFLRDISW